MEAPAHKDHTKQFGELSFAEQAKSITATINNLSKAINRHVQDAEDPEETKKKCVKQVHRLLGRLLD